MAAPDTAHAVLSDPRAPADERYDAQAELQRGFRPLASQLIPSEDLRPVIDYINAGLEETERLQKAQVIQFPGAKRDLSTGGMKSVRVDPNSSAISGWYYEKPGVSYETLRSMAEGAPILNSIIMTRIRQVKRFCAPSEDGGVGFTIRHVDKTVKPDDAMQERIKQKIRFFQNCGWEFNPRARARLGRSNFAGFMARHVRDSLIYDSAPIETEWMRDRSRGISGFYPVDGATVRLCTEEGWEGDPDQFAIQLVQGRQVVSYTRDELVHEFRNPRTQVDLGGYGLGETELLVKVVTAFLNAMAYNTDYFDKNSIPKGLLQLTGEYAQEDSASFRRYWNAMVRGVENRHALPVMMAKDENAKATYIPFNNGAEEMAFAKWMILLTSIACAIYGMDPSEISFESFSAGKSSLSGSDTEQKLADSKDKGLRPLLSHFENEFSDFIVAEYDEDLCFRWVGLDAQDEAQLWESRKLTLTVDELRKRQGDDPHPDPEIGAAPVNPQLLQAWMQLRHPPAQPPGQDFGGPQAGADFDGEDQGDPEDMTGPDPDGDPDTPPGADGQDQQAWGDFGGAAAGGDFGKALTLGAIYAVGGQERHQEESE